ATGSKLEVAAESELIPGAATAQTPKGFPRSHLRQRTRDGEDDTRMVTGFEMKRLLPEDPGDPDIRNLRYQRGYNRFASPWIFAIADPRASILYKWPSGTVTKDKEDAGCFQCERPPQYQTLGEKEGVFELYTNGHFLLFRPEVCGTGMSGCAKGESIFKSSTNAVYSYLSDHARLETRVATTMADTIRTKDVHVAAQNPPVARGAVQSTVYVHSGEVATGDLDLNAGGRAGVEVAFDRSYRSRTVGLAPLGWGWDSSNFARLRQLMNKDVEYRDGFGEVWLFTWDETNKKYLSPATLFVKLAADTSGWKLVDQQMRITRFDEFGRLVARSDAFSDPGAGTANTASGNFIRYLYDASGRLGQIVDPNGRSTTLSYWEDGDKDCLWCAGLLQTVKDWDDRQIDYKYDDQGRLTEITLPDTAAATGLPATYEFKGSNRAKTKLSYQTPAPLPTDGNSPTQSFTDYIEFVGNLETITDPVEVAKGGASTPRVRITYGDPTKALERDRIVAEDWPCAKASPAGSCGALSTSFSYPTETQTKSTDIINGQRTYDLKTAADGLKHIDTLTEENVPSIGPARATLPDTADPKTTASATQLITKYVYDDQGLFQHITLPDLRAIDYTTAVPNNGVAGKIVRSIREIGNSSVQRETKILYDDSTDPLNDDPDSPFKPDSTHQSSAANPIAIGRRAGSTGKFEFRPTPSGNFETTTLTKPDDDMTVKTTLDVRGRVLDSDRLDPKSGNKVEGHTENVWHSDTVVDKTNKNMQRGRVHFVRSGIKGGSSKQREIEYTYELTSAGGEIETVTDNDRKVASKTETDAQGRVISVKVTDPAGSTEYSSEQYGYDADGRLAYTQHNQKDVGIVKTFTTYDVHGRVLQTRTTGNKVNDVATDLLVDASYSPADHRITTSDPYSTKPAINTVMTLDEFGRATQTERKAAAAAGAPPDPNSVLSLVLYDNDGNQAFQTDSVRTASRRQYDFLGRTIAEVGSDGVHASYAYDMWDQLAQSDVRSAKVSGSDVLLSSAFNLYTSMGRPRGSNARVNVASRYRASRQDLSFGGNTVMASVSEVNGSTTDPTSGTPARIRRTTMDSAGRVSAEQSGDGSPITISSSGTMLLTEIKDYDGDLPKAVDVTEPKAGVTYHTTTNYDRLGRVHEQIDAGGATTTTDYDEVGHVTSVQRPGLKAPTTMTYDSRGLVVNATHPDAKSVHQLYDELGNVREYRDEKLKKTIYTPDSLGRVTSTLYEDKTTETVGYELVTGAVAFTVDRAGKALSYFYDAGGRVTAVYAGQRDASPATKPDPSKAPLVKYDYDSGGRLTRVANKDAATEYADFDLLGRPTTTRSMRYANGTGLDPSPNISDRHAQANVWSIFDGERERYHMPSADAVPGGDDPTSPWRGWIVETRDAGGNITDLSPALTISGAASMAIIQAQPRGIGRLAVRQRFVGSIGQAVTMRYGYAEEKGAGGTIPAADPSPGPKNGLLGHVDYSILGWPIGGGTLTRDDALRASSADNLGLLNRVSTWNYDDRSRLQTTVLNGLNSKDAKPTVVTDNVGAADFRTRDVATDPNLHSLLGPLAKTVEPSTWTATEGDVHEIKDRTYAFDPANVRKYGMTGGRRTQAGQWTYAYDELGRLTSASNTGSLRTIEYTYNPAGRIVGRRICLASSGATCVLENSPGTVGADGLPSDTTFVWDPLTDRLLSIFEAGKSVAPPGGTVGPTDGLVRQFVHGERGVDDLVQVMAQTAFGVEGYLPIADESSTGSIETILRASDGTISDRVLYADAYGDAPRYLQGALVDEIKAELTGDPHAPDVNIVVHLSEKIDPSKTGSAVQVAAVKADKSVALKVTAAPLLDAGKNTLTVTIVNSEWKALMASGGTKLEIAVAKTLRAGFYGDRPIMPPPSWAKQVFSGIDSTSDNPVIDRESLAAIDALVATGKGSTTFYRIDDLYLAANEEPNARILTNFQAAPFVDPATGLAYFRARWYDPSTGTCLTPDAYGTIDSSNLYAGFALDPVNRRDPDGKSATVIGGLAGLVIGAGSAISNEIGDCFIL
ncbi:MAG: RHS repeat-associated core domain-containing protein, partial [Acidobacteriota bacterium]